MSNGVVYQVRENDDSENPRIHNITADWADTESGVLRLWKYNEKKSFNAPDSVLVTAFGVGKWAHIQRVGA